jgi:peptidoglycan/LPS O-acetylase OafA/YrhL
MATQNQIQRFYLLDILRGLASFSVLIWHYQHFFFESSKPRPGFNSAEQPGYLVLKPFYEYGDFAVYLFFILSGFVFFSVYSEGIALGSISLRTFAWNRFSRLYPLHFLTLLLTSILQFDHYRRFNSYFVYQYNDLKHFILQLGFISYWGFQDGHSFNGPIWSVSVEVLLYTIFFIFCRFIPKHPKSLTLMSLLGLAIGGVHIGAGIFCFFLGGLLHMLLEYQRRNFRSDFGSNKLPIVALCLTGAAFYPSTFISSHHLRVLFACVSILPALVYFLAWLQIRSPNRGQAWIVIGDLTYSSYLLHFPLQILLHILFKLYGLLDPKDTETLILFILSTYGMSYLTYRGFELSAKNFLRERIRQMR